MTALGGSLAGKVAMRPSSSSSSSIRRLSSASSLSAGSDAGLAAGAVGVLSRLFISGLRGLAFTFLRRRRLRRRRRSFGHVSLMGGGEVLYGIVG